MFDPKMAPVICEMFECWSYACDNDGEGFYDALGDLFMDCVSFGRNGQFFTPQEVCDMMAVMTYGDGLEDGKSVNDPACGSGRMLLAMAKRNRRLKFYGADNDLTCVKMAALNMLVNSMKGEVAWMNTLSMEHYRSYHINLIQYGSHYIPMLTITGAGETYMIERMKATYETKPNPTQSAPPENNANSVPVPQKATEPIIKRNGQLTLF